MGARFPSRIDWSTAKFSILAGVEDLVITLTSQSAKIWPLSVSAVALALAFSGGRAVAQAYTYDPPSCGASYREEAAKPQELRVIWELNSGNDCIRQNEIPLACTHFQAALLAADRVASGSESYAENYESMKVYLRTLLKTNGCRR